MRDFGFVPDWGRSNRAPDRTNQQAFFPASPSGTLREATLSETLAGVLGADPEHTPYELEEEFKNLSYLSEIEQTASELWKAFEASYITTGERGVRRSGAATRPYVIPFHRVMATVLEVDQPRNWWRWYWMLMTEPEENRINEELHERFVHELFEMPYSNLVEKLAIEAAKNLEDDTTDMGANELLTEDQYNIIPTLVPECASAFQADLEAWLDLQSTESSSRWMRGLRDLLCYHYMMYFLQVSVTLAEEYDSIQDGPPFEYKFELQPLYFGMENEAASKSRQFATEWGGGGIERHLYDSWGRLAVLSHVVDIGLDESNEVESRPYTLTEALNEFPVDLQAEVVSRLLDEFPEEQRPDEEFELDDAAIRFSHAVRRYYENMGKSPESQTAYTMGFKAVYQLGRGTERRYIERRQRVGTILRLDRASLRMFARLFDAQKERGHIDEFWQYMLQRGIQFDHRSKQELIEQLEEMGLLQKQSDSGEAMYVQAI
ncbi:DNA phosphorothioation-dependent restriction protein DptG [Natronomonas gomsonensis]|uniref:DNA phosphorothioation-dependent restriction protein DptG n=1 Tax=Natronomonas gomsonensis TaxID=1046043 RepID=UPI0015BDA672|nr:DNA phosphorothioation-dependent restriction protein DptG [Natronomonas gomsonensis]